MTQGFGPGAWKDEEDRVRRFWMRGPGFGFRQSELSCLLDDSVETPSGQLEKRVQSWGRKIQAGDAQLGVLSLDKF